MAFFMENIFDFIKNNIKFFLIIFVELIIIIILTVFLCFKGSNDINNDKSLIDNNSYVKEMTPELEYVIYDIKGAIKNPGVYKVLKGTIINDAITTSGGLTKNASTININLSKEVNDRMVIYIPTKQELVKKVNDDSTKVIVSNKDKVVEDNTSLIDNANSVGIIVKENDKEKEVVKEKEKEEKKEEKESNLISINKANKDELTKLPSIGEAKALKIIEYREENGLFKTIEDIKNVSGIGDSLFEKIKDYITI